MNHFFRFFISLLLAGAIVAPAMALQQDDFCSSLRQVISASKTGYKTIIQGKGQEQTDFFGKTMVYQTSLNLPGALKVSVNKGIKTSYHAVMAEDNTASEKINNAYYTLRENIKSCLGSNYKYNELIKSINQVNEFKAQASTNSQDDMYQPVITVRSGKIDNDYKVVLDVEEPFFLKK